MNLSEALNVALPELPARRTKIYPRIHPKLIMREHIEDGEPTMVGVVSGGIYLYRLTLAQWAVVQLFDGQRSYGEIAKLYEEQTGNATDEAQVIELADALDEIDFWYKTPLEANVTASQKLSEQRRQRTKKKKIDFGQIVVAKWDPDEQVTKLHDAVKFVYDRWFVCSVLGMFAITAVIFIGGWREIWQDTVKFYTFTDKNPAELAEFWLLFCGLGFFHESGHALTCKHFGGEVHNTGFMLIYFTPCFFVDMSQVYVYGTKWPRVATIIGGIWVELMFCAVATVVWWGTPPGSPVHAFTYKVMLITGIAVVLMNLNPLIKLDGYYLLGELTGIASIKECSTEYLTAYVKQKVFHLPVEVPHFRIRRRAFFVTYAILSGLYSYVLMFAIVRFSYNVFSRFSPQWAFVPAGLLALLIFRGRLRSLRRFIRDLYLDKIDPLRKWLGGARGLVAGALALLVLFTPLWPENVEGRFLLEPAQRAVLRAPTYSQVIEVLSDEGMSVAAGQPILRLSSRNLQKQQDEAQSELRAADAKLRAAQSNYSGLAVARADHAADFERYRSVSAQLAALEIASPISGIVATPRLKNLTGSYVEEGSELAEIDDSRVLKARIFIPEFQIHKVILGASTWLRLESRFWPVSGKVGSIAPAASEIPIGLISMEKFKGSSPPIFYVATVLVKNSGEMRPGMSGDAKIRVEKRSIAGLVSQNVIEFARRKFW